MSKENLRIVLWVSLFAVGFFLYTQWEQLNAAKDALGVSQAKKMTATKPVPAGSEDLPEVKLPTRARAAQPQADLSSAPALYSKVVPSSRIVSVDTGVLSLEIDLQGGDITRLVLPKYPETIKTPEQGFVLLDNSNSRHYIAQSGLLNPLGPDSKLLGRAIYSSKQQRYKLYPGQDELIVDLRYSTKTNVDITKRFRFNQDSYLIHVEYLINNQGLKPYQASFYARLKRKPEQESSGFMGMRTYTGAAVNTPDKAYYKLPFADMGKEPFRQSIKGGWAAMIEHYFTTAWVPSVDSKHTYSSEVFKGDVFGVRYVSEPVSVMPGEQKTIANKLYAGPEITDTLKTVSPGLELTVDYGILWPICQPIFWLLKTVQKFVSNWGVAIILTTFLIKLLFYKLSASSYRSMGNMRKLQPRIEALKQRHGDDKQAFGQAVMGLYRQEKVNPLGGCLPILVQIPVFIALYYVLLESVELRHAPFFLWITDLSAKDPFYVLPVIMGLSMLVQQKLSPAPPDPMQAKIMMAMPIVFTFLFVQFPSGLVLYWVVNNILSIAQQWMITRKIITKK